MPTSAVVYSPQAGHSLETLTGTIETDAQFSVQPAANDQIVYPDALTIDAQLNISGPADDYVLWHITAAGVVYHTNYTIENLDAPVLSGQTINQITASSLRFQVQTDKAGGTWYALIGETLPADGDVISTGVSAAVPSAGVLSHTFTGLDPATTYYVKAVHVDADTNVSNYVSTSQNTLASGSVSAAVVVLPPAGHSVATLETGFDPYAIETITGITPDNLDQMVTPSDADYYDVNGNYWSETEQVHDIWHIGADGTITHDTLDSTGMASAVAADIDDQLVTGCEIDTWIEMPDQVIIAIAEGVTVSATIDNAQAQHRLSTNGGSSFDAYSSTARTGLVDGDILEYRIMSGAHYANSAIGSDYTRSANPTVGGVTFTIGATNRNAAVPAITAHAQNQSVTAGATAAFTCTATSVAVRRWLERIAGVDTLIEGATGATLTISDAQLSDSGRQFFHEAEHAEGGVARSPASGYATLTVIANATRLQLPADIRDGRNQSLAGQTVTVDVHAADTNNNRVGAFLYRTSIAIGNGVPTNIDSNQNGSVGTVRAVCFPSAVGGVSVGALFIAAQAVP